MTFSKPFSSEYINLTRRDLQCLTDALGIIARVHCEMKDINAELAIVNGWDGRERVYRDGDFRAVEQFLLHFKGIKKIE